MPLTISRASLIYFPKHGTVHSECIDHVIENYLQTIAINNTINGITKSGTVNGSDLLCQLVNVPSTTS